MLSISFGMIVLNGEPFVRYNLRSLYPFAHQIIIVEGATPAAASIATTDGHSTDTTLATIRQFQAEEDPGGKVILVVAEDEGHMNGFWPGEKDEQSQAYARRATGNYLWQVDVDEFYRASDMCKIIGMLEADPSIAAVSFKTIFFWGGFDYVTDGWYLMSGADEFHRLFRWESASKYVTHRPPTVFDTQGRDLRTINWLSAHVLAQKGIYLYHYSTVFPRQVVEKAEYYANGPWGDYSNGVVRWAEENFLVPIRRPLQIHNVHMHPSWLDRFVGSHPEEIESMRREIGLGTIDIELRSCSDIEHLLASKIYGFFRCLARFLYPIHFYRHFPKWQIVNLLRGVAYDAKKRRFYVSREFIR